MSIEFQSEPFSCLKSLTELRRGRNVFVGDKADARMANSLIRGTVAHNWPSQWHSRFPSGYILISVVNGEKTYKKYFDLVHETINGKPRYIFAATKEVEGIYFAKCAEKANSLDASKVLISEGNNDFALGNFWGACGFRGKAGAIPKLIRSAFRN